MAFWKLYYHFIWGTKNRLPLILPDFETALYKAIVSKVQKLGGIHHAIGGMEDHIHLAVSVPPKIAAAAFIGEVKGNSSHFVNQIIKPDFGFFWQSEYGVLSFSERNLPNIVGYIKNQKKHHADGSLRDDLERI